MQQVKIYIETDSSSPKATEKHYGYVLEVMVSGQTDIPNSSGRNMQNWAGASWRRC